MNANWFWAGSMVILMSALAIIYFGSLHGGGNIQITTLDNASGANGSSIVLHGNGTISMIPLNSTSSGKNTAVAYGLDAETKLRAERLTSLFENDNLELQYGYAENLEDGRGITCGRAGFCTGCGDAYEVVYLYAERNPGNILAKYLPELKRLNRADDSADTSGLDGFMEDWKTAASDHTFRNVQDEVSDELYYKPAMDYAKMLGIKTNLAKAVLYDTIIQHGNGDDLDSMIALLDRAEEKAGGTPKNGIDEAVWLKAFLETRRADLAHAYDEETREGWADSVSRVDVFSEILKSGNFELKGPIKIANEDYEGRVVP